jgi:predicted nuclease of predicted toxin-antitoxin system
MHFKIDENLPVDIADILNKAGHDASTVNEQKLQGTKDQVLIEICRSEHRVLVSLDTDFSDIRTYPPEKFAGIIVLKMRLQAKPHVMKVFQRIIPLISREPLSGHLWVVEETGVRIRGKETANN